MMAQRRGTQRRRQSRTIQRVWVTSPALASVVPMLTKAGFDVRLRKQKRPLLKRELFHGVRNIHGLLCLLTDTIDRDVIRAAPQLQIIANDAVGFDNIDVRAAHQRGIVVTNTPAVLSDAVAEHTMTLIAALARRIVEADQFTRAGKYHGWKPDLFLGQNLDGKILGIVGLGRIGMGVAQRAARGFEMHILYTDIRPNPQFERRYNAQRVSLSVLLRRSDVVSLHVPLLPSTKHLIGTKELRQMQSSAFLVNTSRGPIINERALVAALKRNQIAGAALDVFEHEPRLTPGLSRLSNVILTPHIASATVLARTDMAELAAQNIIAVLSGKKPLTAVRL